MTKKYLGVSTCAVDRRVIQSKFETIEQLALEVHNVAVKTAHQVYNTTKNQNLVGVKIVLDSAWSTYLEACKTADREYFAAIANKGE